MIAIVELHVTTSGYGLRKPQSDSNASLYRVCLTHRSINIATSSGHDGTDRVSRAR
jgi:hypothetical protein